MVKLPFDITIKNVTTKLSYSAGQPMGAYSSWAVMALTHHVIVQVAAIRCYKHNFSNYFLLGDDLVIADSLVAQEYLSIIHTLGMPYSPEKTHVSDDTFEFAKRWFHQGVEITGFSISGLKSV